MKYIPGKLLHFRLKRNTASPWTTRLYCTPTFVGHEISSTSFMLKFKPKFYEEDFKHAYIHQRKSFRALLLRAWTIEEYLRTFFGEEAVQFVGFTDASSAILQLLTPFGVKCNMVSDHYLGNWIIQK